MESISFDVTNTMREQHMDINYSQLKLSKTETKKYPEDNTKILQFADPSTDITETFRNRSGLVDKSFKKSRKNNEKILKNKRKQTKDWYETVDALLFCLSTILYVAIVFNQFKMDIRYHIQSSIQEYFGFNSAITLNVPNDYVTSYFHEILNKLVYEEFWFWDHKYEMISSMRITQRKLKKGLIQYPLSCLMDKKYFTTPQVVVDKIGPYDLYNDNNEENETFGTGYNFTFDHEHSFLGLGGYVISFLKTDIYTGAVKNLTDNPYLQSELILKNARTIEDKFTAFINSETAAITFDFLLAYYEYSALLYVIITFEASKIGMGVMKFNMYIVDKDIYGNGWAYFRAVMEVNYLLLLLLYIVFVISYVRYRIQNKREKFAEKQRQGKINSQYQKSTFTLFLHVITDDWLEISLVISFAFSVVCLVLWIAFVIVLYNNMEILITAFSEYDWPVPLSTQNDVLLTATILEQYRGLVTINLLFLFFRLIKILQHYHKSTIIFTLTISDAFFDIVSFFIFYVSMLVGFSVFTMLFYGRVLSMFTNFSWSFQENFSFALGILDSEVFSNMHQFNGPITILYFLFIIIFLRFIATKILLAIILYHFKVENARYSAKEKNKILRISYKNKSEIPRGLLLQIIHGFYYSTNCCWDYFCCRRKQTDTNVDFRCDYTKCKLREMHCPDLSGNNDTVLESKALSMTDTGERNFGGLRVMLYNSKYSNTYDFEIRNPKFDSENDLRKIRYYYEKKYRSVFVNFLIFLIFTGVFILMFILNMVSPWHGKFHSHFQNHFILNTSENIAPQFYKLNTTEEVRLFIFFGLPSNFIRSNNLTDSEYYYLEKNNILLCNSLTYTIKRQQMNQHVRPSDKTMIFAFNDNVRQQEPMSMDKMDFENKTYYQYTDPETSAVYPIMNEKYHTYRKMGGYFFNFEMDKMFNMTVYPPNEFTEMILDSYFTYAIVEFFLKNSEFEVVAYVRLEVKADWGTYFSKKLEVEVLKYEYIHSALDYLKFVMEVIFIILLLYLVIKFVEIIIQHFNSYDKWYKNKIAPLKLIEKETRDLTMPEFIRKLDYILTFSRFIDFFIIVLSLVLLYLRAMTARAEVSLNRIIKGNQEINKFQLRDILYEGIDARSSYDVIGNVIIFFSCVKFMSMLNLGKYFSLLIRTFEDSRVNNITFILILLLIQPCFFFNSHLSFGERSKNFSTFGNAFMSCIEILLGYVKFFPLQEGNPVFGPIFFFGYLVLINMILLNLFVSILYGSYMAIKDVMLTTAEVWSEKTVFLFCCTKLKNVSENEKKIKMIESEFELEKQAMKYESKMLINQENNQVHEWIKHEIHQIKMLDDNLYELRKRREDMKHAFENTKIGSDNLFEDCVYQGIQEKHLKCYSTYYLNCILTLTDQLEENILSIERVTKYIQKHREYMKYEETLKCINGKQALILNEIAQIDKKFIDIRGDMNAFHAYQREIEETNT